MTSNNEPAGLWNVPVPRLTDAPGGSSSQGATSSNETANKTDDVPGPTTQNPSSSQQQQEAIHQEGIQHLKENTEQPSHLDSSQAAPTTARTDAAPTASAVSDDGRPPASNPSSQDPTGGISAAQGAGGVAAVGAGVGAASLAATRDHGENDKSNTDSATQASSSHLETSPAAQGNPTSTSDLVGQPPSSNPAADDPSGGIAKGHGGVSSAAYVGSPTTTTTDEAQPNNDSTLLGTVASYLGLSQSGNITTISPSTAAAAAADGRGEASNDDDVQPGASSSSATAAIDADHNNSNNVDDENKAGSSAAYGYVAAAGAAVVSTAAAVQERVIGTKQTQPGDDQSTSAAGAANSSTSSTYLDYSSTRPTNTDSHTDNPPVDHDDSTAPRSTLVDRTVEKVKDSTTSGDTASSSSPSDKDHSSAGYRSKTMSDSESQSPAVEKKEGSGNPATRENKSAIPTAGGERLGEKHWGESKVVPEVPKPEETAGAGVSSADGQPNDETRANTAKNVGGASDEQHGHSQEKEGFVDKVKDKLNIGSKKD